MPAARRIDLIVIHCSASRNAVSLARASESAGGPHSAAAIIDQWHQARDFKRSPEFAKTFNPSLKAIGYHYVIDVDGTVETGRHRDEVGAHVHDHNATSIGICLVGTDRFTAEQWVSLKAAIVNLDVLYNGPRICGHRDLSPDKNGDGKVTPNEFTKICPGFNVSDWLIDCMEPLKQALVYTP